MKEIDLPDMDDMYKTIEAIRKESMKAMILKAEIEELEARTIKEVTTNEKYFINGKPPSATYARTAYLATGLNGEILEKRKALAEVQADHEYLKLRFELDNTVIDVWRTQAANKRLAVE